jgi:hypothetical protein
VQVRAATGQIIAACINPAFSLAGVERSRNCPRLGKETTMKRLFACATLGLTLVLPNVSEARDHHDHYSHDHDRDHYSHDRGGRGYYHHDGYGHDGHGFIGDVLALPFIAGAAILGAAVTVATAPFNGDYDDAPPPPNYYPQQSGYYQQQPAYYPQQPRYYAPPQRVYYGQQYPNYAPQGPVYYEPAPY